MDNTRSTRSTRSELHHCFGLGTVELLRTDFVGGATVFHCRHERKRLFCACCHSGRVIRRGTVARRFRLVPVGCRPTWLEFDIQRLECRDCGTVQQERLTFAAYRSGLLNWYTHPISTGPLEAFNNKAQTMKRQAYGYRNMQFFMLKLRTLHSKKYALTG